MSNATPPILGSVVSLWRYPVKSMMGEELNASEVTPRGLLGDRAYALVDSLDGKVASAKNPRKWPQLFDCRAVFVDEPRPGAPMPPVRLTLPDGTLVTQGQGGLNPILSQVLQRDVTLQAAERGHEEVVESTFPNPWAASAEEYWPDLEGLDYRDTVTDFALPEGTFFDAAAVHVLTTATLDRLRELYPQGRFEARRFRPNLVVAPVHDVKDFVENGWIDHTLALGDDVRLRVTGGCPRCVMTTLAQGDLPQDPGILRTAAQHNHVTVGVYAAVVRGGRIRRGDPVRIE
jgi:MOSC domain-containing protein